MKDLIDKQFSNRPWFDQFQESSFIPEYEVDSMIQIDLMLTRASKAGLSCEVIRHFYQYAQSGCTLIDSINGALKDHKLEIIELE